MPKEAKMDYCTWTTNCSALGIESFSGDCEKYRCCYTCPKKLKCEFPCKDREKAPHTCSLQSSKEEAASKAAILFSKFKAKEKSTPPKSPKVDLEPTKPISKKATEKPKNLWEGSSNQIPNSVKDLATQTGSTYARANYLIKTKKLSFEQAFKILKG